MQFTPTEDKKLYKLPDGARRLYETKKAERFPPATSMTVETSDAATSTVKPTKKRKREDSIVDPYSMTTSRYGPKRDRGAAAVEKRRKLKVAESTSVEPFSTNCSHSLSWLTSERFGSFVKRLIHHSIELISYWRSWGNTNRRSG